MSKVKSFRILKIDKIIIIKVFLIVVELCNSLCYTMKDNHIIEY